MSCRAPGLLTSGSELNISDLDGLENQYAEESNNEVDLDEEYDKLEKLKQRVLHLRGLVAGPLQPHEELHGLSLDGVSKNPELQKAQVKTMRAKARVAKLSWRLKGDRKILRRFNAELLCHLQCSGKLLEKMGEPMKWRPQHEHYKELCRERYSQLDISLCNYLGYSDRMRPIQTKLFRAFHVKIPMFYYRRDFRNISMSLGRIQSTIRFCAKRLMAHIREVEEDLDTMHTPVPMASLSEVSLMINRKCNAKAYVPQRSSIASLKTIIESKKWTKKLNYVPTN
ncbi:uncharacterized protein Dana_GF23831 [Drosophila ananassae]|uniref:Uncharacterized protein n=1 Tax=Drosophila ananassae TaxID=7217 RepID=B3M5B7_DROAN|nr:uncharacterized protein LOC6506469 [Drosophila ananassae]EDV40622.1 uncharacterized protein Dana_GF23831 [Drosophila ananassae]